VTYRSYAALQRDILLACQRHQERLEALDQECQCVNDALAQGIVILLPIALKGTYFVRFITAYAYHCATTPGGEVECVFDLYDNHVWSDVLRQAGIERHPYFTLQSKRFPLETAW